ncbi:zinc finger MYM-type protein 1-like, partial [Aphis craccivora]
TQGLAFRGHDENKISLNQGNFKEACVLFSKHMPKFFEIFSKDTNYTSHHIQDEIIDICANSVKDSIIEEAGPGIFSIMCDEARYYKDEQMSLYIRYVKDFDIKERFLGFIDCSEKQDAQALSDHILNYLQTCKLSKKAQIISQSYDGANVMPGKFNGVQSKIKTKFPHATLHTVWLTESTMLLWICAKLLKKPQAFSILLSVYMLKNKNFWTNNTRWNCRYKNCEALKQCFRSILIVLKTKIENEADRDVNVAIGILSTITKRQFVVVLFIMSHVLCTINILSNMFHDKNATLGKSAKLLTIIGTSIQTFAKEHGISIDIPSQAKKPKRKRRQPCHLVQFLVSTTTGATSEAVDVETILAEDFFRINIYFKVLDSIIVNLKNGFSMKICPLLLDTQFIDYYKDLPGLNICQQSLRSEMMVAKNYLSFLIFVKIFQLALTLPISSATCERSFSALRKIKTWLRTSIQQKKFNELSILCIEKDKTKFVTVF